MKKTIAFCAALLMVLSLLFISAPAAFAANPEGMIVAYVLVPESWKNPCLWAWDDAGNSAFTAWPGGEAEPDPNNSGWYYCYLPNWANNIIVNANDGTVQTSGELKTNGRNFWIKVDSPDKAEITFTALTSGVAPDYVEKIAVHAKVPASWNNPCLWAWLDPQGTNVFAKWPGGEMRGKSGEWYTLKTPSWVNAIIINANNGSVQTKDLKNLEHGKEVWVSVNDDLSAVVYYENPDLMVPGITVRTKVPADWKEPCLWAWLDPDGTNAFASWPGEPFTLKGDWYEIALPGWANSFIVNANGGKVQTGDMKNLETGKDIWIVVTDSANYAYDYKEIASATTSKTDNGKSGLWVGLGIGGLALIGVIMGIFIKRKK